MKPTLFFTFLIFTLITLFSLLAPFPFTLISPVFVFIGIPIIDKLIGTDKSNPDQQQEGMWKKTSTWATALYFYFFTHFAVLILALYLAQGSSIRDVVIMGIITGLYTGGLGITVAHELCHKKEKLHQFLANAILASVWYRHFSVEHVRGHHIEVATFDDPASARRDESIYRFLPRTILGALIHAFKIDSAEVIKGLLISSSLTVTVYFILGREALIMFLIQALVAIILLELVNYVEHYGLSRKKLENGRYEKVLPIHSWNSSHKFSNLILFNLQRHSDHHSTAHLPYTVLKHQDSAPQLPTGYPGMILLALIPSYWFKLMNSKIDNLDVKLKSILFLTLLSGSGFAVGTKKYLCTESELVLFSCTSKNKVISICATPDLDAQKGYLVYRMARSGKTEFEFPKENKHPKGIFSYRLMPRSSELNFKNGEYEYAIAMQVTGQTDIVVMKGATTLSSFPCPVDVNELTLDRFEKIGISI